MLRDREAHYHMCPDPIFIIGAPRSGTSALAWSLAHHPDFWTSQETEFLGALFGGADTKAYEAGSSSGRDWFGTHDCSLSEFRQFLGLGMNALLTSRAAGKRWIDQTPGYTLYAEVLAEAFPAAVFLHIVRDGRAVIRSMLNFRSILTRGSDVPYWAESFEMALRTWLDFVRASLEHVTRHPDRAMTVRNEDLARDPHAWLEEIFTFLGVPTSAEAANFFASSRVNSSFGPTIWGSTRPGAPTPPACDTVGWRFGDVEEALFDVEAGELNQALGY
jgi:Sulfotransferase family